MIKDNYVIDWRQFHKLSNFINLPFSMSLIQGYFKVFTSNIILRYVGIYIIFSRELIALQY